MTDDEILIRQAVAEEARQAVPADDVLANLRMARRPKSRRTALIAVAGLAAAAAVTAVVIPLTASRDHAETPPAAVVPAEPATEQNVLLIGVDNFAYTDSLVLLRIGANGSVRGVSLPRDTKVPSGRLNQVHQSGVQNLLAEVRTLTGVPVDHYITVQMAAFEALNNAVGGVQVCLNRAAKDAESGIDLPAGTQTLSGSQALAFVRQRHDLPNGDIDRIVRQQAFLRSVVAKLAQLKDPAAVSAMLAVVRANVSTDGRLDLAELAGRLTSGSTADFATIPVTLDESLGQWNVDPAAVRSFTTEFLAGTKTSGTGTGGSAAADSQAQAQIRRAEAVACVN
jgi:LCP family protein required for cell wall assembly